MPPARKKVPRKTPRPSPKRPPGYQDCVLATRQTLKEAVLGQDHALETLTGLVAAARFRTRDMRIPSPRLLLVGPTSTGKTHITRTVAKLLGLPTVTVNAATVTPDGYRGGSFTDALRTLTHSSFCEPAANGVSSPRGLLIIEELDKVLLKSPTDDGWAASSLQSLLPLWGGEDVLVEEEMGGTSPTSTSEIVVIATGVFEAIPASAWGSMETGMKALAAFGIPKELLNRLTHLVALRPLEPQALRGILQQQALAFGQSVSNGEVDFRISEPTLYRIEKEIAATGLGLRHALLHFHKVYASILQRWDQSH